MPVYMAVRPNSRSIAVSQGKGFDVHAAKASALMESLETWHAENIDEIGLPLASYRELRSAGAPIIDIETLSHSRRSNCKPQPDLPILWIEGRSLFSDEPFSVPLQIVCQNHLRRFKNSMFLRCSNGLASGNNLLEAALHGLCEVIERDATYLWNLDGDARRTKALQLDPATITDPRCRQLLERVVNAGAYMAMWDITSDLGVPTYACLILDTEKWRAKSLTHGYGCHPSPAVALTRAMTEAAQCRLTEIAASRDDIPLDQYTGERVDEVKMARVLRYLRVPPQRDFASRDSLATDSFEGDLQAVLDRLVSVGLDSAYAVNLSKPDLGVPVVHVVVPGLEASVHNAEIAPGARGRARLRQLAS
jgi:ribosomal protein S12 methylthiotransferase accessory factor